MTFPVECLLCEAQWAFDHDEVTEVITPTFAVSHCHCGYPVPTYQRARQALNRLHRLRDEQRAEDASGGRE